MSAPLHRDLREAAERVSQAPVELLSACTHPMQSSRPLIEIMLRAAGGAPQRWLLKDAGGPSARPGLGFLYQGRREVAAYRTLTDAGLVLPRLIGADVRSDRCWLFLEVVEGTPLWQSGDAADWSCAAEWLAELHSLAPLGDDSAWLRYDSDFYGLWMERARRFAPAARLDELDAAHEYAISRLLEAPAVTVHGDYYPSNVLVRSPRGRGVCPLDLELAGVGSAALDLAMLTAGLPAHLTAVVIESYRARLHPGFAREELEELLLCARLHLAIRWLGWMPRHRPPAHQRFDWIAEAHTTAEALGARTAVGVAR
jgi:hypothetical protein